MGVRLRDYEIFLRHLWMKALRNTSDLEKPVGCLIQSVQGDTYFGCNVTVDGSPILEDKSNILHAEQSAIQEAGDGCLGGTLLVTKAPCLGCAEEIVWAGLSKVVMPHIYTGSQWYTSQLDALDYLNACEIEVTIVDFDDREEMKRYQNSVTMLRNYLTQKLGETSAY